MLGNEIIETTDELRVVWYFEETAFPYVLEGGEIRNLSVLE